jgi:hypothetical protein
MLLLHPGATGCVPGRLVANRAWVPAEMLSMPDRSAGMYAVQATPLARSLRRGFTSFLRRVQVHMRST